MIQNCKQYRARSSDRQENHSKYQTSTKPSFHHDKQLVSWVFRELLFEEYSEKTNELLLTNERKE